MSVGYQQSQPSSVDAHKQIAKAESKEGKQAITSHPSIGPTGTSSSSTFNASLGSVAPNSSSRDGRLAAASGTGLFADARTSAQGGSRLLEVTGGVQQERQAVVLNNQAATSNDPEQQLQELQALTRNNFGAALVSDHRLALQPDVRSSFTSAEDVIQRLLPYHVFQIPEEDLHYTIEQHKQENLSRPLKRKRRRTEEATQSIAPSKEEKPLAEVSSSASKPEQASSSSSASASAPVVMPDTTKKSGRAIRIRINPPKSEEKGKQAQLEPTLPWWEADVEDDNFPSTAKTIELLDRYATLHDRLHKLLIRADGGYTSAQAQVFMETQMDRLGLDYERECLAEDSRALTQARTRWEAVVRSNPKHPAKAGGPASYGASPSPSPGGAAFTTSSASRKSLPQMPAPRPNPNAEIPKFPIPLQIPLSVFPQLHALGISPALAPHLLPALGPNALSSAQTSPLSHLSNVGTATAPRPAPPDQNEAALLTGVTQGPTGQFLHVSVRLDKLLPAQLSGLAAVMSSLQAASNAAAAAAAAATAATAATAGKGGASPSPGAPTQANGSAPSSHAPGS